MEVLERLRDELQTAYEDGDITTFCGNQYVMIDCPRHTLEKSTRNSVGYFNDVITLQIPEQVANWFAKEYLSVIVNC